MRKPNFGPVVIVMATLFVGQIAAACACVMQPGHAPVAEAAHQGHDHDGHDAPAHCIDPCVVTASADPSSQQVKGTVQTFEFTDDALTQLTTLVGRDPRLGATLHTAYEIPPAIRDTLVRLHTLLLTKILFTAKLCSGPLGLVHFCSSWTNDVCV